MENVSLEKASIYTDKAVELVVSKLRAKSTYGTYNIYCRFNNYSFNH